MKTSSKRAFLFAVFLGSVLLNPMFAIGESQTNEANARELEQGRRVYEANCAICHGASGDGRGMAAHMFATQPRDFTKGVFKFRSTPSGSLPTDQDLGRTITEGLSGTPMTAQPHLTKEQLRAVVAYIKTLSKRFSGETPAPELTIPDPPRTDADLLAKGEGLYREAGCADCHGAKGLGDGPSAGNLKDDWGHPAKPGDLTTPLKRGSAAKAVYRTLLTGLDGTPMPSYRDALTEEQMWALALYVSSLNKGVPSFQERQEQMRGQHVQRMHGPRGGMMQGPRRQAR